MSRNIKILYYHNQSKTIQTGYDPMTLLPLGNPYRGVIFCGQTRFYPFLQQKLRYV